MAGNLTFFALAPYDSHILETVDINAMMAQDYPTIEWGPGTDPAGQVDMCVAVSSNQPRQLEVPLEFHHATSQVYFAANYLELEEGEYIIIDTVILHNLIGKKHVTIVKDAPYVEWEPDGKLARDTDYLLYWKEGDANSTLKNVELVMSGDYPEGIEITNEKGVLFLVPQTYYAETKNVEITVKYDLWKIDTDIQPDPIHMRHTIMEGVLPPCTWEPDTRYRYILKLNDKTRDLDVSMIHDYYSQPAKFYAMTCAMSETMASSTVGSEYELVATVGPDALLPERKKVKWKSSNEAVATVDSLGVDYPLSNRAKVKCLSQGTTTITATVKSGAAEDEVIVATCLFEVIYTPAAFEPYGTGYYSW